MSRVHGLQLLLGGLAVGLVAGCGGGGATSENGGTRTAAGSGSAVVVDGSSTVFRISKAAQLAYSKSAEGKGVKVLVGNHGTGGGFGRYLQGEVDIVDASRTAKPEEESQAKAKGLEWTRYIVGYDGITVVVHPSNDFVKSLTVEQLKKLMEPDSKVTTWKELDPSWPDRRISLYTPDNDSGTYEFFCEAVIGKKAQRKDVQASPDDNTLVTGVAGDPDALGYFGYAYYAANKAKLKAVGIAQEAGGPVMVPGPETILDGSYKPLSRPLFLYVKNTAVERPEVSGFLKYYIENVGTLAKQAGYVAPHEEDQKANLEALPGASKSEEKAAK